MRIRASGRGFTLVEVLVVVAIIGVLATIAIAYTGESRANIRAFSEDLVAEIDAARLRSVSTRRWNRVHFDLDEERVIVDQSTTTGMMTPDDDSWETISKLEIPKSVMIYGMTTSADIDGGNAPDEGMGLDDYLILKPDGTATARTIYLQTVEGRRPLRVAVYRATGTAFVLEEW